MVLDNACAPGEESLKKKLYRFQHTEWCPLKACKHPLWSLIQTAHPWINLEVELWKNCTFQITAMSTFNVFFSKLFQPRLYSDFPFSAVCSFWKYIFLYRIIYKTYKWSEQYAFDTSVGVFFLHSQYLPGGRNGNEVSSRSTHNSGALKFSSHRLHS